MLRVSSAEFQFPVLWADSEMFWQRRVERPSVRHMIRSLVLLLILSGLAWWLHGEQQRGQFRQVDETFLDFLLANTRNDLKPDPEKLKNVVFVRLAESDKAEYSAWPPAPIDYHMMVKALAAAEPDVLVITEPLHWPEPKPAFIDQLAQTLLPLPSVVLAAGAASGEDEGVMDRVPSIARISGDVEMLQRVAVVKSMPEDALARGSEIGLVASAPLAAFRNNDRGYPSLELQTIARVTRTPLASVRLTVGPGAGLHLGDALFIPLSINGSFPNTSATVPEINGLDLMTASLTDADEDLAKTLGKHKTLVIGIDNAETRQRVASIATALALPRVQVLPLWGQVAAWVVAGLIALGLVWMPKTKALTRMMLGLFVLLTASYLAFQVTKTWCPPAIPAALLVAGGLFSRIFGRVVSRPEDTRQKTAAPTDH